MNDIRDHFQWRKKYYMYNVHKSIFSKRRFSIPEHGLASHLLGEEVDVDCLEGVVE